MNRLTENKVVLVVRSTRLEQLRARFATRQQARFYVSRLGADFSDYEVEDATYQEAVRAARQILAEFGRVQVLQREMVPNYVFGADDIVVAIGQDGLVANVLKYLDAQPLVGVNPDPKRFDGQLLPFRVPDLRKLLPEVLARRRQIRHVSMAEARLNTGLTLRAVNDLFIGPRSHGSARYAIRLGRDRERQSSSGVVVSTGLGSTGWLKSLVAGALGVARRLGGDFTPGRTAVNTTIPDPAFPWDSHHLMFTVREPFPTRATGASLVFGRVTEQEPLILESEMSENGVIFSDGIEQDFLEFNSGTSATITVAQKRGHLVL